MSLVVVAVAACACLLAGSAVSASSVTPSYPVTITVDEREGHDPEATPSDRLALRLCDRVALRHRRRRPGGRGRRPVGLPEERAEDDPLGLHPERRGDRRLQARPRDRLLRPEGHVRRAPEARHSGRDPGRAAKRWRAPTSRSGNSGSRPATCSRRRRRRRDEGADRRRPSRRRRVGPRACRCTTSSRPTSTRRPRARSSGRSTRCSVSRTSPMRPTRPAPATRSSRPSTSSRRART